MFLQELGADTACFPSCALQAYSVVSVMSEHFPVHINPATIALLTIVGLFVFRHIRPWRLMGYWPRVGSIRLSVTTSSASRCHETQKRAATVLNDARTGRPGQSAFFDKHIPIFHTMQRTLASYDAYARISVDVSVIF